MYLVQAADKYQLTELKNRCFYKLCCRIKESNVGKIAVLAYLNNAEEDVVEEIGIFVQSHWENLKNRKGFTQCVIAKPHAFFKIKSSMTDFKAEDCATDTGSESVSDSELSS